MTADGEHRPFPGRGWPAWKRILDLTVAIPALILASPVMLIVWCGIRVSMGSPAFFYQRRPGFLGRPFTVIKFRTMRPASGDGQAANSDGARLTRLGRILRRWSLDELPGLWSVVRGDMSIVGPRPLLMEYLERYNRFQMRRHEVPPGLTGWAQVNGRNASSWEDRFRDDVWYVDHMTLLLDLKIILLTILVLVNGRGVAHDGHVTMPPFGDSD